jgi:hypothetical protein
MKRVLTIVLVVALAAVVGGTALAQMGPGPRGPMGPDPEQMGKMMEMMGEMQGMMVQHEEMMKQNCPK